MIRTAAPLASALIEQITGKTELESQRTAVTEQLELHCLPTVSKKIQYPSQRDFYRIIGKMIFIIDALIFVHVFKIFVQF